MGAPLQAPEQPLRLGAVIIGAIHVGVAAETVLHALPLEENLATLPRRRGGLCGVVEHAGKLVPVVDLARWVDVGANAASSEHARGAPLILLLADGGRCIGLRVDAIIGLADVATRDLMRLHHDNDPDEVFHTAVKIREPAVVLSVLDVTRLVALAMAWHQDGVPATAAGNIGQADTMTTVSSSPVSYGLLKVASVRLAVPVTSLAEVTPMPALQRAGRGIVYCVWRGRYVFVPSADLLAPDIKDKTARLLAIIEHDGLAVGVQIDAVLGVQPFTADAEAPGHNDIGVFHYDADGPVMLLNPARLLARFPEAALSIKAATGPAADATKAVNPTAHIVFEADGMASTPVDAIEEVAPFVASDRGALLPKTIPWRGKAIAVRDLRPLSGAETGQVDRAQTLIVRQGERHIAFLVSHVRQLIPPRAGRLYRVAAVEFITVGEGGFPSSYRVQDLGQLTQ